MLITQDNHVTLKRRSRPFVANTKIYQRYPILALVEVFEQQKSFAAPLRETMPRHGGPIIWGYHVPPLVYHPLQNIRHPGIQEFLYAAGAGRLSRGLEHLLLPDQLLSANDVGRGPFAGHPPQLLPGFLGFVSHV